MTRVPMANKLGRRMTSLDELLPIMSHDSLITWSCEIWGSLTGGGSARKRLSRQQLLVYLLTWMAWRRSSSSWRFCIPSIFLGSAVSWRFYWPGVVYRWLLRLGPGPKTFQRRHLLFSLGMVQSIAHHCISCRCSFHMVRDAGIGWWKILMTTTHTSLVYVRAFEIHN